MVIRYPVWCVFSLCVDLDLRSFLFSLLSCVCGGSLSALFCCVSRWLVGWGSCLYQHLYPNLQLGPLRHCSLFCFCCFLALFFLSLLAFSIISWISCLVSWQFFDGPVMVIFVSSPLSSILMYVWCFVWILRLLSPPFPITLPVYSLLIDIVVVLFSEVVGCWRLFDGCCVSSLVLVLFCLGGWVRFLLIIRFSSSFATIFAPSGVRWMLSFPIGSGVL